MNNDINNIDTVGLHSSTDINNAPKTQADMDCICHTAATKIQRWLRYRMFLLSIYENTEYIFKLNEYISKPTQVNLFDVDMTNNQKYIDLQKAITDKTYIQHINKLLKKYYRTVNVDMNVAVPINATKFLSAWIMVGFPESTFGITLDNITNNPSEYPADIFIIAQKFIAKITFLLDVNYREIHKCSEFKRILRKNFNQYSTAFTYFLEVEKYKNITDLIQEYYDISKNIEDVNNSDKYDEHNRSEVLSVIEKSKAEIVGIILMYDKSFDKKNLDLYVQINIAREKSLKNLYPEILSKDITTKEFKYLSVVLTEIKESFEKLGGKKIKLEGTTMFDDVFDHEMIQNNITSGSFTSEHVRTYGTHMKHLINELQAPVHINDTNERWNLLDTHTHDNIEDHLSKMLFFILDEIKNIVDNINNINVAASVGINVFNL